MTNQLDDLMERVLVFVDRHGTILSKSSSRVSSSLEMQFKNKELDMYMYAMANGMGNGACSAKVKVKGKVVFDANGSYTSGPYHVIAKVYKPGDWESKL
jgi:hypothetical protein